MVSKEVIISQNHGLTDRAATHFVRIANEYTSTLTVAFNSCRVNAKSLLGVLAMGAGQGDRLLLMADGPDEEAALTALVEQLTATP